MRFKDQYKGNLQAFINDFSLLFEAITLKELDKSLPSNRNKFFFKQRKNEGDSGSFFKDIRWTKNKLTLEYKVQPTFESPNSAVTKKGNSTSSKQYTIEIAFFNADKYLGTKNNFAQLPKKEQVDGVRKMINNSEVRIHSSSPDFLWQGIWERATKNDYNLHPFPKNKKFGKDIWKKRHENKETYSTKHIMEVVKTIPFLASTIAKKIREKYTP